MGKRLHFTKMEGCGNDYVYVSAFDQEISDFSFLAKKLSDRHFGIGGDGVIFVCPSERYDGRMRMFNEDGSEGRMCGNGIRCVAKFLYDKGLCAKKVLHIETRSGVKEVRLQFDGEAVVGATVDMGEAILDPERIPVLLPGGSVVGRREVFGGYACSVTCVSMGNPHCVVFVEDPDALDLPKLGPGFENSPLFPERVNTEFVRVLSPEHLRMRVWERGSGETLACGTGACASVVAATLNGYCREGTPVRVSLRGGDLSIVYNGQTVLMTGPANTVFEGTVEL